MAELKDLIKVRRTELGLTLEDVAKLAGVTKATVQRWESGNIKDMRRDKIAMLAKALQTTPAYLMGWGDPNQTDEQAAAKDAAIIDAYHKASPEIQLAIQRILKEK